MAIIKLHITRVGNWDDMAETSKRGFIQYLVFPFAIAPGTLDELLHFGDHFQRPQG